MMKRTLLVLAIVALLTTGAFGQIVLGVTGVQYYEKDAAGNLPTLSEAWADFKDGTGVYWGGYGEIILHKLGLGLSFNQQTYPDSVNSTYDMWNYDVNFFLSYHILGGRSLIDPFLQAGIGEMAYDYKNKAAVQAIYPDLTDDPLFGSIYYDFGLGLGVNLGGIGIFAKGMWNVQSNEPLYSQTGSFPIFSWPVMPFKWVFGAKLIL
ncbi:MAG TPA: hypothetical protein VMX33_11410 [bacterium]|nr:hypothetical protein [bacterium]